MITFALSAALGSRRERQGCDSIYQVFDLHIHAWSVSSECGESIRRSQRLRNNGESRTGTHIGYGTGATGYFSTPRAARVLWGGRYVDSIGKYEH